MKFLVVVPLTLAMLLLAWRMMRRPESIKPAYQRLTRFSKLPWETDLDRMVDDPLRIQATGFHMLLFSLFILGLLIWSIVQ